ncbi:hypothetical protein Z517_06368 [Fonsecaea pedrosoi CBS 271.37]|uniref:FAD-binding PCMH-type domain-containing protein n=1 Tax=Fonsecaea pedrosoi CBS 271.37 TaxID=1442368 RepID=A0A0D2H507_9EURO|nr:uncharacterized protein Z517_06368 [Fonsecaea pedrosoi CBS 271.37]KIW79754.1 hypothetical protein Z517_06368 [Fonsecaea pedrosoi CBS 271.37]
MSPTSLSDEHIGRDHSQYEELRTRYFNARVPAAMPAAISCPSTTADVIKAVKQAAALGQPIGVRAGGHLFPCCSLLEGGLLIDVKHLNSSIDYDTNTKIISFGPGRISKELAEACTELNRFFPFGHSPTVAAGGFLLCGGQGWFCRGWGLTSDSWILGMEIVTAEGQVVIASREKNTDLFWAARGSGQGFFGIVTRFWAQTMPARHLYTTTLIFNASNKWRKICTWMLDTNDRTPRYGVETAAATVYANKNSLPLGDEITDKTLLMAIEVIAYADSEGEARTMLSEYNKIPEDLKKLLVVKTDLQHKTWKRLFDDQDALNPCGQGERWQCDSILSNPKVSREELVRTMEGPMCDLPSRRSLGCIYIAECYPDAADMAGSLPQQYYMSTMTCWTDPTDDTRMREWMYDQYSKASAVGVGQYIADYDVTHRKEKVMSEANLQKWLKVRAQWDPEERFPAYKNFAFTGIESKF